MAEIPRSVVRTLRSVWAAADRVRPEHVEQLKLIVRRLQQRLAREMRKLAPDSYTSVATASKRLQLQALAERLGVDHGTAFAAQLQAQGEAMAKLGRSGMVEQLAAWEHHFKGVTGQFVAPDLASDLLSPGLLEHYSVSRRVYGMEAIGHMRQEMAAGALNGESLAQTWERVARRLGQGFGRREAGYRAERIVRTEHSFAINRRQLDDFTESFGARGRGWWKSLVATFDQRTGPDSVFVHGQLRRVHQPFEDNEQRVYMTPPNRPNDREVMIFIPDEALTPGQKRRKRQ